MSLTDWVNWDRELIDALFDKPRFVFPDVELEASPLTKNYATVGTAFDYLFRAIIAKANGVKVNDCTFPMVAGHGAMVGGDNWESMIGRSDFVDKFRAKLSRLMGEEYTKEDIVAQCASDCITLAKLESIYRSGQDFPDDVIFTIDTDDVQDLTNLATIIPGDVFVAKENCILNPTFGDSSKDIGGADADLILDDLLIDIKTTKILRCERRMWRQLIGYWLLNEREDDINGEINRLGIYFARFGCLLTFHCPREFYYFEREGKEWGLFDSVEESIKEYQVSLLEVTT